MGCFAGRIYEVVGKMSGGGRFGDRRLAATSPNACFVWPPTVNNGTAELPTARSRGSEAPDELTKLKKELLQAEVRLAKARATVTGAEVDIKVLNARLKAFVH